MSMGMGMGANTGTSFEGGSLSQSNECDEFKRQGLTKGGKKRRKGRGRREGGGGGKRERERGSERGSEGEESRRKSPDRTLNTPRHGSRTIPYTYLFYTHRV